MRLVCPSCETEYEVHDTMIPAAGRDVQCSNCMRTWFQSGPTSAGPELASDLDLDRADDAAPQPPKAPLPEPQTQSEYEDDEDLSPLPSAAVAAMAAKRRSSQLDDEALGVIQDEVAREQSARKAEAAPIETQIDLGIDDTETKDRAVAARDRMRGKTGSTDTEEITEDAVEPEVHAPEPATKRELLPDIEEINSTLAEAPEHDDDLDDDLDIGPLPVSKSRRRSGFRLGFGLMLLISAIVMGLYIYAPAFARSVPSMAGFFEGYVSMIDSVRVWLDRSAQDLSDQITKLLGTVN